MLNRGALLMEGIKKRKFFTWPGVLCPVSFFFTTVLSELIMYVIFGKKKVFITLRGGLQP
jgi:hypothetical protein